MKDPIQIDNQTVTFKGGATFIEISYPPELNVKSYTRTLRFNLITEWKEHREYVIKKDRAEFYWLGALRYQILDQMYQKIKEVEYKISLLEKSIN